MTVSYVRAKLDARTDDVRHYGPLVLLLIPGPAGTASADIATALAERFDCARFNIGKKTDAELFGAPAGYVGAAEGGALPNAVREAAANNNGLVIVADDIETVSKKIWNQMLSFLDEGHVTDATGTAHAPKKTIILMTTGRAAEQIAKDPSRAMQLLLADGNLQPELLGRIHKVLPLQTDEALL